MIPTATYRLQFRNGMTFDRAAALVPYLKNLGISHLYASPIFTATKASTHGYDVTDANEIEPSIGGREGFERLVAELKAQGLGLIIDIVPNHMASSLENAWWRDVLEYGKESRYARHFDIDWSRRLTLPFLGDTFDAVLENGEIAIKPDPATGKPAFAYYDNYYPLAPATWQGREAEILALTDKAAIADLHERQPWKLMSWRDAARSLSYRRFFEVTGLVGMRVEDKTVFDDTHRLILELVRTGAVDGLRIDHIDGLADPKAYLARLRQEVGPACYITVEKILAKGEQLPDDWPVSGTTGYEFIASLAEVLVDDEQIDNLRQAYETVKGAPVDMRAELNAALMKNTHNASGHHIVKRDRCRKGKPAINKLMRGPLAAFFVKRNANHPARVWRNTIFFQRLTVTIKAFLTINNWQVRCHTGNAPMPVRQEISGRFPGGAAIFQPDTPVGHTGYITIHNNQRWKVGCVAQQLFIR